MQASSIYVVAVGLFSLAAIAYATRRDFARRAAWFLSLVAAAAVIFVLATSQSDPLDSLDRGPKIEVSVWWQLAAIIGLLVASVLGVLARTWTARRALTDADNPSSVAAGVRRRDSLVMSMIVSVLLSTSLFGPWIEATLSAGSVWPALLPFVAAFEKGFLWPSFFERFAAPARP